jgi:hypothetical protein
MTSVLIVGTLRATNRRASDGHKTHGPQVRVVSKATATSRLSHIPRPTRNAAPRWKVKRPRCVSSRHSPQAPPEPQSARPLGRVPTVHRAIGARKACSVGQAPKWPRGLQPGASITGFGASRWSMDSRAWNTIGPGLYLAVTRSPSAAGSLLPGWTWSHLPGLPRTPPSTASRRPSGKRAIRISLRARAVRSPVDSGTYPALGPQP